MASRLRSGVDQEIRFCVASDGVRLAYAKHGRGAPLVKASNWLTHLEFDWETGVWRHWLESLGRSNTVIRYDLRGCGMSDRDVGELSLERWVLDLETVIDAAGVERCSLLGISGGAGIALAYAARNPSRVERVVAYGGWASGRFLRADEEQRQALRAVMRAGWRAPNPAFRRLFTMMFLPEGTPEQMAWYDELQRRSASPAMALRVYDALGETDATGLLPRVAAPTLVLHSRRDLVVPFREGRRIAAAVPSARLITLDSRNHLLLEQEPAWHVFLSEVGEFLGSRLEPIGAVDDLSPARAGRHEPRGRGAKQRRDRGAVVPQRANGRAAPYQRVREASDIGEGRAGGRGGAFLAGRLRQRNAKGRETRGAQKRKRPATTKWYCVRVLTP